MTLTKRIKELCTKKKVTFAEIERSIGLSNGQIRRWDKVSPRISTLEKVADYFQVSVDFLLGRTSISNYQKYNEVAEENNSTYPLVEKDIAHDKRMGQAVYTDIEQRIGELIKSLSNDKHGVFSIDSEPMDKETKNLLILSLEHSLKVARMMVQSNKK